MIKFERIVALLAALITLIQFMYAISPALGFDHSFIRNNINEIQLSTRIGAFLFLEIILAWGFGNLMKNLLSYKDNELAFYALSAFIVSISSAWVTLFNTQVIVISHSNAWGVYDYVIFTVSYVFASIMAVFFMYLHLLNFENKELSNVDVPAIVALVQVIAFFTLFITVKNLWWAIPVALLIGILVYLYDEFFQYMYMSTVFKWGVSIVIFSSFIFLGYLYYFWS